MAGSSYGIQPIEPGDLLKKMEQQLQEGGTPTGSNLKGAGLADLGFLTNWPDRLLAENPRGKQFVALRPSRFPVWQSVIQGAGSVTTGFLGQKSMTGFDAVVSTVCFTQINADVEMRSAEAIAEPVLGVLSFITQRIIPCLQFWTPFQTPAADPVQYYVREPVRMTDGGFGMTQLSGKDGYWHITTVDWQMRFTCSFPS